MQVRGLPTPQGLMYSVSKVTHARYGNIIELVRSDDGMFKTPEEAVATAKYLRRLWIEETNSKVRILIDSQTMTLAQAQVWAREEYKQLPKCEQCAQLLLGDVVTHSLSSKLFCSAKCADKHYLEYLDSWNDNEESEYFC